MNRADTIKPWVDPVLPDSPQLKLAAVIKLGDEFQPSQLPDFIRFVNTLPVEYQIEAHRRAYNATRHITRPPFGIPWICGEPLWQEWFVTAIFRGYILPRASK